MSNFSITNSDIYNQLRNSNIVSEIKKIDFKEDLITEGELSSYINTIRNKINQPSKKDVLDMVDNKKFVLVNNRNIKMPNYLLAIPLKTRSDNKILINLSSYMNSKGEIYPSTLYGLFQNGVVQYKFEDKKFRSIINDAGLMLDSAILYSSMAIKVLDKVYALKLDKFNLDVLTYMFSKFFLIRLAGRPVEKYLSDIAYKTINNPGSRELIEEAEREISIDDTSTYQSIFKLFEKLSDNENYNNFSIRTFIEQFVKMYGESSILSIDHLPSFYSTIFAANVNAGLNKEYIIVNTLDEKTLNRAFIKFFNKH